MIDKIIHFNIVVTRIAGVAISILLLSFNSAIGQTYYSAGVAGNVSVSQIADFFYQLSKDDYSSGLKKNLENKTKYFFQNREIALSQMRPSVEEIAQVDLILKLLANGKINVRTPGEALTSQERAVYKTYIMPSIDRQLAVQMSGLPLDVSGNAIEPAVENLIILSPETAYTWVSLQAKAYHDALSMLTSCQFEYEMFSKKSKAYNRLLTIMKALLNSANDVRQAREVLNIDVQQRENVRWNAASEILGNILPYVRLVHNASDETFAQSAWVYGNGNMGNALDVIRSLSEGGISNSTLAVIGLMSINSTYRNSIAALGVDVARALPLQRNITDVDIALLTDEVSNEYAEMYVSTNAVVKAHKRIQLANKIFTLIESKKAFDAAREMDMQSVKDSISREAKNDEVARKAFRILDMSVGGVVGPRGYIR